MKTVVKDGQSLLDIAIEAFGTWEAMMDLSRVNGLSMSEVPDTDELLLPDKVYDVRMQNFCRNNDVCPSTARDIGESIVTAGVFTEQFTIQFA